MNVVVSRVRPVGSELEPRTWTSCESLLEAR